MPRTSIHTYRLGNTAETENDIEYANSTPDAMVDWFNSLCELLREEN